MRFSPGNALHLSRTTRQPVLPGVALPLLSRCLLHGMGWAVCACGAPRPPQTVFLKYGRFCDKKNIGLVNSSDAHRLTKRWSPSTSRMKSSAVNLQQKTKRTGIRFLSLFTPRSSSTIFQQLSSSVSGNGTTCLNRWENVMFGCLGVENPLSVLRLAQQQSIVGVHIQKYQYTYRRLV